MGRGSIPSFLIQFLLALITIPLLYVVVFVLLAVVAVTLPYRVFVYIMAKMFESNIVGFINGMSGLMATDPLHTASTLNIVELFVLDNVIPIQKFQEIFQDRVLNKRDPLSKELVYGRLQQYWVNFMGYNMWRWDPGFSIENHIIPSMESYKRKDIPKLLSDLVAQSFKRNQSPWEITLIDKYQESCKDGVGIGNGRMVVAVKFHHALADGFSLVKMFQRDLSNRPLKIPNPGGVEESWWKKAARLHLFPLELIYPSNDGYDPKNTWIYPLNDPQSPEKQKYYSSIISGISVSDVSCVRRKYNVSYFTVLLHCVQKGVRQAMEKEAQSVPDKIMYKFARGMAHHPEGCVNHAYATAVTLSMKKTSTQSSLQDIETEIKKEKLSMVPIGFDIFISILSLFPASILHFVLLNSLPPGFGCSNVAVLNDGTSFEGANVTDLLATVGPASQQRNLMITAWGDGGKQSIVLSTNQSNYSSQEAFAKLGDYIKDEFNYILKSLQDKQLTIDTIK